MARFGNVLGAGKRSSGVESKEEGLDLEAANFFTELQSYIVRMLIILLEKSYQLPQDKKGQKIKLEGCEFEAKTIGASSYVNENFGKAYDKNFGESKSEAEKERAFEDAVGKIEAFALDLGLEIARVVDKDTQLKSDMVQQAVDNFGVELLNVFRNAPVHLGKKDIALSIAEILGKEILRQQSLYAGAGAPGGPKP